MSVFRPLYSGQYVTVFSHPRSGTHLLEAFLAKNFYKGHDLYIPDVVWGHWKKRTTKKEGNEYGKLFGSHIYPTCELEKIDYPIIYIYRDGRAVAYSIWKTENFLNPKHRGIIFSDFLRLKLDWKGAPAYRAAPTMTIAEHWSNHVLGWMELAKINRNIMLLSYERLLSDPIAVYAEVKERFFPHMMEVLVGEIDSISEPVGLLPNKAIKDSWKEVFTKEDERMFMSQINDTLRSLLM